MKQEMFRRFFQKSKFQSLNGLQVLVLDDRGALWLKSFPFALAGFPSFAEQ